MSADFSKIFDEFLDEDCSKPKYVQMPPSVWEEIREWFPDNVKVMYIYDEEYGHSVLIEL